MSFGLLVAVIGIGLKLIIDFEYIPNLVPVESVENREFDFIIIGGGTAGCVLSYHLTKYSNFTVLLIEAGGIFNGLSIIPLLSTFMQGTRMDWKLKSTQQKYSSRGLIDKIQFLPRGKGLGGSHNLNYLLHSTGGGIDEFDEWMKYGGKTWNYDSIKRFLNRHEMNENRDEGDDSHDDVDEAKLSFTTIQQEDSVLGEALISAEKELKNTLKNKNITFSLSKFTVKKGRRHSVYHEYLKRAFRQRNLSIMIHAKVERIEFNEKKEAVAVIIKTQSRTNIRIRVKREIILSAGAYHSPHILQLSGVGNQNDLKTSGINLVHHEPSVGMNLFDHMNFPLFVSINASVSITRSKVLSFNEILRYLLYGSGVFATFGVVGAGKFNESGMILFGTGSVDEKLFCHIANFNSKTFHSFFPLHANASQEGFVMLNTCWRPKSRGSVKINPENIFDDPLIEPKYLSENYDVSCLIKAVRMQILLMKTEKFRKLDAKIQWPRLKSCENFGPYHDDDVSERYLECLIRHAALTGHHPSGTCALGSVVDENLNVKGVKKLRIVDGSIFPTPISFFPNTVIIAIAEKASRIILNENQS
jgi:choline dehydrogenase